MLPDTQFRQLYLLMENGDAKLLNLLTELNSHFKTISERTTLVASLVILLSEQRLLSYRCSSLIGLYFLYHLMPTKPPPYIPAFARIYSFYLRFNPSPERSFVLWLLSSMREKLDHCTAKYWLKIGTSCTPDQSQLCPSEIYFFEKIKNLPFESRAYLLLDRSALDEILANTKGLSGVDLAQLFFSELKRILHARLSCSITPHKCSVQNYKSDQTFNQAELLSQLRKATAVTLTTHETDTLTRSLLCLQSKQLESIHITTSDIHNLVKLNKSVAKVILSAKIKHGSGFELIPGLESLKISVNALEVLNFLDNFITDDFMIRYISKAVKRTSEHPGDYSQNDIQILCMFINYLIRNNFYITSELLYEIKSLCVQHSTLREAAELFKQISTMNPVQNM